MNARSILGSPFRRALALQAPKPSYGVRCLSSTPAVWSGHSKWATIKHDKGKNDAAKSKARQLLTRDITSAVKLGGPNPSLNPRLALCLEKAKKASVPKSNVEAAIARGQGLSASGAALENITLEAMLPGNVALVIECATDSKLKTLADLRIIVKDAGGSVTPVSYLFTKLGRIVFVAKEGTGVDEVLDEALEAGEDVLDVTEDVEGRVVVFTEPSAVKGTAETLSKTLGLEISESEIIWDPNEDTKVPLEDEETAARLYDFCEEIGEVSGVQAVYANWSKGAALPEDLWNELRSKVAV